MKKLLEFALAVILAFIVLMLLVAVVFIGWGAWIYR